MRLGRWIMGAIYITAGIAHFIVPRVYASIMPDYLPAHRELVLISGVAELAGGIGMLVPRTQRAAAWGIILLLIAVFPANLWMVQHSEKYPYPVWALWARLPLQVVLMAWAWQYTRQNARNTMTA